MERIAVARTCLRDDFGGQWRRWLLAVPPAGVPFCRQVIAQWLLVETWLRVSRLIAIRRREARTVGRHHLINQDDLAIRRATEFEFGVGDDDADLLCD